MMVFPFAASHPPCTDLLTEAQAGQLHLELLAGHETPPELHPAIANALVVVDTGCGNTMGNHVVQFQPGTLYESEDTAVGASGSFTTKQKGLWVMPMQTVSHGIQVCKEAGATLHEECPYVLWLPCRASIKRGGSLW